MFELNDIREIKIINDDAIGLSIPAIVLELKDGTAQVFLTQSEQKPVIAWIGVQLPKLTDTLKHYLKARPFEDFLIAILYQSEQSSFESIKPDNK